MEILSGKYKRTPLLSPRSELTHPMGSRERLALFNSLVGVLPGALVLDAFAGTGALGLEALSLGASSVIFVEKSKLVAKTLSQNIKNTLKSEDLVKSTTKIIIKDVKSLNLDQKFDLILADPPYDLYSEPLIAPLTPMLKSGAILALSLPKTAPTPLLDGLEAYRRKNYAAASIALYRKI